MDTPGLSDPDEEDEVIIERINEMMFAMHPGPHALLLVVRCNARFTKEDYQVIHFFIKTKSDNTYFMKTKSDNTFFYKDKIR